MIKETRVVKAVFPESTNHYETLFGGEALKWMDEVAFLTATRYTRQKFVTVSLDRTDFKHAIPGGSIAEIIGSVNMTGKTSLRVKVDIFIEEMYSDHRELAVSGMFTMVAVGEHRRPVELNFSR